MATDLGQAYVQIVPKATGISKQISNLVTPGSKAAGASAGSNIAGGIKKAIVAAGIGAAVVGVVKGAVEEGGKLQQSYGGLETIYGDAAGAAKNYAAEAAKAGISANDYAEQAVSFGASLKQAFGGDTTKAVEAANTAIMDMTDNAAKMGTPIENIQNAYQGFAKQNYTMLDNLKLGYGGTKSEMERLLADAEKISGVKYDISNLGDVYSAIHVIQGELGLTGVAAQEASETFEGSLNAMKANAKNLLADLALGNDVTPSLQNLAKSVTDFLIKNLIPMVVNVVKALPAAIATVIKEGVPALLDVIINTTPQLLTAIMNGLPMIIQAISTAIQALITAINENGPEFLENIINFVIGIAQVILENLPTFIQLIATLLQAIIDFLVNNVQLVTDAISQIINMVVEYIPVLLPLIINAGLQLFTALIGALPQIIEIITAALPQIINAVITVIINNLPLIIKAGVTLFVALVKNLPAIISAIVKAIPQIISAIVNAFAPGFSKLASVGKNLISGLWEGIKGAGGWLWDKVTGFLDGIWDGIKDFFGIASPSKEMAWIGEMIDQGLAHGILSAEGVVSKATDQLSGNMLDSMSNLPTANASSGAFWNNMTAVGDSMVSGVATATAGQGGSGDIVIPIYLYPSGPKMGEQIVKTYDTYKRRLG